MMRRRQFIGLIGGLVAGPSIAGAQAGAENRRIGFVSGGPPPPDALPPKLLREALQALGHTGLTYVTRYAAWHRDRLPSLLSEVLNDGPDLIFAFGEPAVEAARAATETTPIVFMGAGDAVAAGLIGSL